jgi:hypothetical protein
MGFSSRARVMPAARANIVINPGISHPAAQQKSNLGWSI